MTDVPKSRAGRSNAFDRAREAVLGIDAGWWQAFASGGIAEIEFSDIQQLQLGDENCVVGSIVFERRIVSMRREHTSPEEVLIVTRPVMTRFSSLPLPLLERLARDILEHSEEQHRAANLQVAVDAARSFDIDEAIVDAREILGDEATEEEVHCFAEQMRLPEELAQGGDVAAKFFDENVSLVSIEEDGEGGGRLLPEPAPPPGTEVPILDEWDIYTPEEVARLDGPETDAAYAFRVIRLCEAIRDIPDSAVQLAVQLGAVTREWEIWREQGEFISAGRARFAQQIEYSKSRMERPWMPVVKDDLENGRIGKSVTHYARAFRYKHRGLNPPSENRIRNFVSELRRAAKPS